MKMWVVAFGLFGILLTLFALNGCDYPTSYKAFVHRSMDSDYKEYERLCKENLGKVVYARARQNLTTNNIKTKSFMWFLPNKQIVPQVVVLSDSSTARAFYIKIIGFHYDTLWNKFYPELFIMPHSETKYLYCGANLEDSINEIKQEAMNNNSDIGEIFDDENGFDSYTPYMLKILFKEKSNDLQ